MSAPSEPPFSSVAIIGLGLIGGSIALGVRERWPASRVTAVDRAAVLAHAIGSGAVDRVCEDVASLSGVDLIVLAAPVRQNIQLLQDVGRTFQGVGRALTARQDIAQTSRRACVVTDVGGTKQEIVAAARALPPPMSFVGGHPLAGAERGGFAFARPDLFVARPWIFTPESDATSDALDRLSRFVTGLGARPTTMTAADHDRLMAFVSHLPQLTASALMEVIGSVAAANGLSLAGQGLLDTTRLASSPASVWKDICATNPDAIEAALDRLIARLTEIRQHLRREEAIETLFDEAGRWRAELMKGRE
ncbi:MAG: prephenate dehydrogenase/arogenate dehydrogenase family protein [Acidobacteria bacterium]|nr:prephenate dehydrogenase/arogenate dehydrogenase family protein [Acidobacteriota bacterium]